MATTIVMPWFNPYASIASATGGFVPQSVGSVGQICNAGSGTINANLGTTKTYATLSDIAADTTAGTAHSGCPIIPCSSADTLIFQFLAYASVLNSASENYTGDGVTTYTIKHRFTVWGVRPSYQNGVDEGPYIVEPIVTYLMTASSTGGFFAAYSSATETNYAPLLDANNLVSGEPATPVTISPIQLTTAAVGTATTNSIDIRLTLLTKVAGLSNTFANFVSAIPSTTATHAIGFQAIPGLHRYSHFMLGTKFDTEYFPRVGVICLGLSTTA
jgi:hypothetical protein